MAASMAPNPAMFSTFNIGAAPVLDDGADEPVGVPVPELESVATVVVSVMVAVAEDDLVALSVWLEKVLFLGMLVPVPMVDPPERVARTVCVRLAVLLAVVKVVSARVVAPVAEALAAELMVVRAKVVDGPAARMVVGLEPPERGNSPE